MRAPDTPKKRRTLIGGRLGPPIRPPRQRTRRTIRSARAAGWLGDDVPGPEGLPRSHDVTIRDRPSRLRRQAKFTAGSPVVAVVGRNADGTGSRDDLPRSPTAADGDRWTV